MHVDKDNTVTLKGLKYYEDKDNTVTLKGLKYARGQRQGLKYVRGQRQHCAHVRPFTQPQADRPLDVCNKNTLTNSTSAREDKRFSDVHIFTDCRCFWLYN